MRTRLALLLLLLLLLLSLMVGLSCQTTDSTTTPGEPANPFWCEEKME